MASLRTRSLLGVTAVSLFAAFPAYSAETKPQVQQGLTIVDANKKKVGDVIGFTNDENALYARVPVVLMKIGGSSVTPAVLKNEFVPGPGGEGGYLYYTFPDCSGQAYHTFAHSAPLDPRPVPFSLHKVFNSLIFVQDGEPQVLLLRSFLAPSLQCFAGVEYAMDQLYDVIPVSPAIDLTKHFTPPFSVK